MKLDTAYEYKGQYTKKKANFPLTNTYLGHRHFDNNIYNILLDHKLGHLNWKEKKRKE